MKIFFLFFFLVFVVQSSSSFDLSPRVITAVQIGDDLSSTIAKRVLQLLNDSSPWPLVLFPANKPLPDSIPNGSIVLSFGNTTTTRSLITKEELKLLGPEGFIVRSNRLVHSNDTLIIACDGNAPSSHYTTLPNHKLGLYYATYALLELLGFAFYHPLAPSCPKPFIVPKLNFTHYINIKEQPYWPIRGWHYHTQHPLELTNLMQGWGDNGPDDAESWENMLPEFQNFLEWLVANRQNRLEFLLLAASDWENFVDSTLRQRRLRTLTEMGRQWGIMIGVDVPIAEYQQHGWYMTDTSGTLQQQLQRIYSRIDWLMEAGFEFLSSESGFTEFTHPDCKLMLSWMNATAVYTTERYKKPTYIKVHISAGQFCPEFKDPRNGGSLNFNYLPYYADSRLGIYPHTVQLYTFVDPAPTYGNTNFTDMFNFTFFAAGQREVLYYGETAFWVNFDIDVPLFLPIYASARLFDLRLIARTQIATNKRIQGQINFDSGWEWSYWLNDLITARASWNPFDITLSHDDALLLAFREFSKPFGSPHSEQIAQLLVETCKIQHELLVEGKVNGLKPDNVVKRNGIAYLEGWDTWAQLQALFTTLMVAQPLRIDIEEMFIPFSIEFFTKYVRPLLHTMESSFASLNSKYQAIFKEIPPHLFPLWNDIVDSMEITFLRAKQIAAIYDYLDFTLPIKKREQRLADAVNALSKAQFVVQRREAGYRVPISRIASWKWNPTAYSYTYLWPVHSLYYFYRDILRAMIPSPAALVPCYMNIINIADVVVGEGLLLNLTEEMRKYFDQKGWGPYFADCFAAPEKEPHYSLPPLPFSFKEDNKLHQHQRQHQKKKKIDKAL